MQFLDLRSSCLHPGCSNLGMRSAGKALPPIFTDADMGDPERCPGWVSLDICNTTVTSAGPLAKPINPTGSSILNKCR